MKITDIKLTDPIYLPTELQTDSINALSRANTYTFCQVFTDEGITGFVPARGGALVKSLVEEALKPYVVGEDPINNERIWSRMYWGSLSNGRRGAFMIALSIIDNAVWDIKGKAAKQPINKLLGGFQDSVNTYGSGINLNLTNDELVKQMTDFVKDGFKAVKMKIGHRDPKIDLERIRLVRAAIGPDIDLMVDANNAWGLMAAIDIAKRMEEFDIYWLEEPILADEIGSLAKLAKETSIPIAVGENHYGKWEFKEMIEQGAVEVVQCDIGKCGGVTEFLKIAAIADAYGLPVCPHNSDFIDVPCIAAIPNGLFQEYVKVNIEPVYQIVRDPIRPVNGMFAPSNKPGFGIELIPEAANKFKQRPAPELLKRTTFRSYRWPPYV
jgi:D-arabinonate dehydratase